MAKFGFNTRDVAPSAGDYDLLPEGTYTLRCIDAENKTTAKGGQMIKATFEVASGQHAGRRVWHNFNTVNSNPQAEQIGHQQLSAWAHASGRPEVDDTDKLMNRKFDAKLKIEAGSNGYKDQNRIGAFLLPKEPSGGAEAASQPAQQPAPEVQVETPPKADVTASKANPWD